MAADYIWIRVPEEIMISGVVQGVDLEEGFITVLNRRIHIAQAGFITEPNRKPKVGRPITVIAVPDGTDLVARQVFTGFSLGSLFP